MDEKTTVESHFGTESIKALYEKDERFRLWLQKVADDGIRNTSVLLRVLAWYETEWLPKAGEYIGNGQNGA